jgi:hypothetical protein
MRDTTDDRLWAGIVQIAVMIKKFGFHCRSREECFTK